jgi:hypothetical protein
MKFDQKSKLGIGQTGTEERQSPLPLPRKSIIAVLPVKPNPPADLPDYQALTQFFKNLGGIEIETINSPNRPSHY